MGVTGAQPNHTAVNRAGSDELFEIMKYTNYIFNVSIVIYVMSIQWYYNLKPKCVLVGTD